MVAKNNVNVRALFTRILFVGIGLLVIWILYSAWYGSDVSSADTKVLGPLLT